MDEKVLRAFEKCGIAPRCGIREKREVMLLHKSGLKFETYFAFPDVDGPCPTIAVRTCYPNQMEQFQTMADQFARLGYVFAFQFCRGIQKSEGEWNPNVNERQDGLDFIDCLCEMDEVGNIGYFGCSYLALTGWAMADAVPDRVKTMYLTHYGTSRFTSAYQDGLFRHDILTAWAMGNAGYPIDADFMQSTLHRPHAEVDVDLWGGELPWYRDYIVNTSRSDAYWQTGFWKQLEEIPKHVKIPLYIGTGWYDHHFGSTMKTYEVLNEDCKAQSLLRIGCWRHNFDPCADDQVMENLENDDFLMAIRWFERVLREGGRFPYTLQTYTVGEDKWHTVSGEKQVEEKTLYLAGESLCDLAGDYDVRTYDYDPDHPHFAHGGDSLFKHKNDVGSREVAQEERADELLFESEALEEAVTVAGSVSVKLYVSSDCEDTAFYARLLEERNGKRYHVRGSITTLGYRNHSDDRQDYIPNEVVPISIDMWDIDYRFQKGSKIILQVMSSYCPEYSVHLNGKGPFSLQKEAKIAHQSIFCTKQYPSRVILPTRV